MNSLFLEILKFLLGRISEVGFFYGEIGYWN